MKRLICLLVLLMLVPARASTQPLFQPPAPGAKCTLGSFTSGAIGMPLGAVDVPGKNGNEVRQVFRVLYVISGDHVGFAGWLYSAFDGTFMFAPAGHASIDNSLPLTSLRVAVDDPRHLPVADWLVTLARKTRTVLDDRNASIVSSRIQETVLAPCFAPAWDGAGG